MRLPDMNNLGRVIKGAVTALGCLIFAMMFFVGMIALSDYSVAQSHNHPGAAEGATLAEIIMLVAFLGGSALLVWIARTLIWPSHRERIDRLVVGAATLALVYLLGLLASSKK